MAIIVLLDFCVNMSQTAAPTARIYCFGEYSKLNIMILLPKPLKNEVSRRNRRRKDMIMARLLGVQQIQKLKLNFGHFQIVVNETCL